MLNGNIEVTGRTQVEFFVEILAPAPHGAVSLQGELRTIAVDEVSRQLGHLLKRCELLRHISDWLVDVVDEYLQVLPLLDSAVRPERIAPAVGASDALNKRAEHVRESKLKEVRGNLEVADSPRWVCWSSRLHS